MNTFPRSGVSLSTSRLNPLTPASAVLPLSALNARVHISFSSAINHPALSTDSLSPGAAITRRKVLFFIERQHDTLFPLASPRQDSLSLSTWKSTHPFSPNTRCSSRSQSAPRTIFSPTTPRRPPHVSSLSECYHSLFQSTFDRSTSPSANPHSLPHALRGCIELVLSVHAFPPLDDNDNQCYHVRACSDRSGQWHLCEFP